jgi:hypothetical protein
MAVVGHTHRNVIDDVGNVLHVVGSLGRDRQVPAVTLRAGLQRRDEHALPRRELLEARGRGLARRRAAAAVQVEHERQRR